MSAKVHERLPRGWRRSGNGGVHRHLNGWLMSVRPREPAPFRLTLTRDAENAEAAMGYLRQVAPLVSLGTMGANVWRSGAQRMRVNLWCDSRTLEDAMAVGEEVARAPS